MQAQENLMDRFKVKLPHQLDLVAITSIALIVIFGVTLFTLYLFPIYPDEIAVRFWLSRLPYDFPEKISGQPTCLSTFTNSIPATMYLPGLINWAINGWLDNIPVLRQVGLTVAFSWVAGLSFYLYARVKNFTIPGKVQLGRSPMVLYIAGFMITLFSVGVFPFFLITNRSEQLILPSVILLVAIFLISRHSGEKDHGWSRAGLLILYFTAISLILYGHPKGLFLTPFFIVVGLELSSHIRSPWPFAFVMALLGLHIAQEISAVKYSLMCSELPQFEAMVKKDILDPAQLFYDPRRFLDQAYNSCLNFPRYLHQLGFQQFTDINYLIDQPLTSSAKLANIFIKLNIAVEFLALLILLPVRYYRKDVVAGQFVSVNLVLLVLLSCTMISAIFNLPKNWYDAGYLYALLLIILIFFIGENYPDIFQRTGARKVMFYLGCVAFLSQAVLIHRNLPAFMKGYAGPGVSIAKYDSTKELNDLAAASLACDIDSVQSKKVIVDDYTYLYFHKSKLPMAITYIGLYYNGDDLSIRQFLSKADSDGLVVHCSSMPATYMPYVNREGNVCCIPKETLKGLLYFP